MGIGSEEYLSNSSKAEEKKFDVLETHADE